MKLAVVYNPVGDPDVVDAVEKELHDAAVEAAWLETTEDDPGRGQAQSAIDDGCDVIMAIGGDGTVRAAVEAVAGTDAKLAIVPAGTGNLLARNLDIPRDPSDAVRVALGGTARSIDVGYVNGEAFTVIAGAGVDSITMDETSRESKDRLGVIAYVVEGVRHVFDDPIDATIKLDDANAQSGSWASIMVGNLGRLQGGVDLFPESAPDDGMLDVLGLSAKKPLETVVAAFHAVTEGRRAIRGTASNVVVDLLKPTVYQLDGEPRDAADRLEFEIRKRVLTVRCPTPTPEEK